MTGVEGYVESTASGFLAGVELARRLEGLPPVDFPREPAMASTMIFKSLPSSLRLPRRAACRTGPPHCGANAECTPEYLVQFAYLGSFYAARVLGRPLDVSLDLSGEI